MVGMCSFVELLRITEGKAQENGRAPYNNLAYQRFRAETFIKRAWTNIPKHLIQSTDILSAQYEAFLDKVGGHHLYRQEICQVFST